MAGSYSGYCLNIQVWLSDKDIMIILVANLTKLESIKTQVAENACKQFS